MLNMYANIQYITWARRHEQNSHSASLHQKILYGKLALKNLQRNQRTGYWNLRFRNCHSRLFWKQLRCQQINSHTPRNLHHPNTMSVCGVNSMIAQSMQLIIIYIFLAVFIVHQFWVTFLQLCKLAGQRWEKWNGWRRKIWERKSNANTFSECVQTKQRLTLKRTRPPRYSLIHF